MLKVIKTYYILRFSIFSNLSHIFDICISIPTDVSAFVVVSQFLSDLSVTYIKNLILWKWAFVVQIIWWRNLFESRSKCKQREKISWKLSMNKLYQFFEFLEWFAKWFYINFTEQSWTRDFASQKLNQGQLLLGIF